MIFLRSLLFNVTMYTSTFIACIALLPTLVFPRKVGLGVAHLWLRIIYFLEKNIIGLDYEVRGQENLPQNGTYLIAAKHQSAYETMKLHVLFHDPSVVLKKELLMIPLWGWFLAKVGVIAIDRKDRDSAMRSIVDGAKQMKESNRPVVIFPQGTRVKPSATTKEKPYKGGIVKMAEATGLPIIPMALNSGVFWGRNTFIKYPGKVIFEFLPPMHFQGDKAKMIKDLEQVLENKSSALMEEAYQNHPFIPKQMSLNGK